MQSDEKNLANIYAKKNWKCFEKCSLNIIQYFENNLIHVLGYKNNEHSLVKKGIQRGHSAQSCICNVLDKRGVLGQKLDKGQLPDPTN